MSKISGLFWAILSAAWPASASVVYTFTETWSNPYNRLNPTGTYSFSFTMPDFLPGTGPQYIRGSQFLTCDLTGLAPGSACSGAWLSGDANSANVQLLVSYPCPDCLFDPYTLASVHFEGASLQSRGDWTAPAGTNSTAELVIADPPDLMAIVSPAAVVATPEPGTIAGVMIGLGGLVGYRRLRIWYYKT